MVVTRFHWSLAIVLIAALPGCAAGVPLAPPALAEARGGAADAVAPTSEAAPAEQMPALGNAGAAAPVPPPATGAKTDPSPAGNVKLEMQGQKPLLVYDVDLGLQVAEGDLATTLTRAVDAAEGHGGYLVSQSNRSVKVRVPSGELRPTLAQLGALGDVTRQNVSAEDVSETVNDLEVRLKNLEGVRARLEQFLSRTSNVSEALTVGKELEQVASQIDVIKGRLQFLRTRAAYSLITVSVEPRPVVVKAAPQLAPPPPPPRTARLPVKWLPKVGLDDLLSISEDDR